MFNDILNALIKLYEKIYIKYKFTVSNFLKFTKPVLLFNHSYIGFSIIMTDGPRLIPFS